MLLPASPELHPGYYPDLDERVQYQDYTPADMEVKLIHTWLPICFCYNMHTSNKKIGEIVLAMKEFPKGVQPLHSPTKRRSIYV